MRGTVTLAFGLSADKKKDKERNLMDDNVVALYTAFDSRWRHDQDPEGLIQLVTNAINSMLEIRMCMEYGDYSASYFGALELRAVLELLCKSTTS